MFETKYWLNRASVRGLMSSADSHDYASRLTDIARQLNLYVSSLKGQRSGEISVAKTVKESSADYTVVGFLDNFPNTLFDEADIGWLES